MIGDQSCLPRQPPHARNCIHSILSQKAIIDVHQVIPERNPSLTLSRHHMGTLCVYGHVPNQLQCSMVSHHIQVSRFN